MSQKLNGKFAIVTGASSGIGRASALALAAEGAMVVVTARRQERLDALVSEIKAMNSSVFAVAGDANDEATARKCVETAMNEAGKIDILLNNTGMGNYKNLVDTSLEEYDLLMDTNMRTTFIFTRQVVPQMLLQKQGTIIMISSMAGLYGFANQAVYCASKFSQVGFAQALDKELRPGGIKVGVICPGGVKMEFAIGAGRTEESVARSEMLEATDVADAVLLACTQAPGSRIIEIQLRTMSESL